MVEDLGNMKDVQCLFRRAQSEVVVLRTVKALAQSADPLQQVAANHDQMADVVVAAERIGGPVGLEMGKLAVPVFVEEVLVRVDEVRLRVAIQCLHDFQQGKGANVSSWSKKAT